MTTIIATNEIIYWIAVYDKNTKSYGVLYPGNTLESPLESDSITIHNNKASWLSEMQFQKIIVTSNDLLYNSPWFRWSELNSAQDALNSLNNHKVTEGIVKWANKVWLCNDGKYGFPCVPDYILEILGIIDHNSSLDEDESAQNISKIDQWIETYVTSTGGKKESYDNMWLNKSD